MKERIAIHEDLFRDETMVEDSSDRVFGFIFSAVFLVVGLWPTLGSGGIRIWALVVSGIFLVLAIARATTLAPLKRLWGGVGRILHRVLNPVIMGLLFFGAVTPTALVLRLIGRDLLRLRFDRNAQTYWLDRRPPGPAPKTMRNQF